MVAPLSNSNSSGTSLIQQLSLPSKAATGVAQVKTNTNNPPADSVTLSPASQTLTAVEPAQSSPAPTEVQVLLLSWQGLTAPQIAQTLNVSVQTVTGYLGTPVSPGGSK